jgi:hypothetical protein
VKLLQNERVVEVAEFGVSAANNGLGWRSALAKLAAWGEAD